MLAESPERLESEADRPELEDSDDEATEAVEPDEESAEEGERDTERADNKAESELGEEAEHGDDAEARLTEDGDFLEDEGATPENLPETGGDIGNEPTELIVPEPVIEAQDLSELERELFEPPPGDLEAEE